MSQFTNEQIEEVVNAIWNEMPEGHYVMFDFGTAIEENELQHLFTEDQMNVFSECDLKYQIDENEDDEEECDCGDGECDCDDDTEEEEGTYYEIRRDYPWSSGSWDTDEESLEENMKEEITRVVKLVIERKK